MPHREPEARRIYRKYYIAKNYDEFYRKRKEYNDRPEVKTRRQAQYRASAEKKKAYAREWEKNNPDRSRENHWRKKGIHLTVREYDALVESQGGVCAICNKAETGGRRLSVDHCHHTGTIRGLLCTNCNRALGHLRDDPALFIKAINYLQAAQAEESQCR